MPSWKLTYGAQEAVVELTEAGELLFEARHDGQPVIAPSPLGLRTAHADLATGLAFDTITERAVDETYRTVIGKRRDHHHRATEWTLAFSKGTDRLELQVQVSDQGIGYRYRVPWTGPVTVTEELSGYRIPPEARAVLLPYDNGRCDYEEIQHQTTVAEAESIRYGYPALFGLDDVWLLITESGLDGGYAGSRLTYDGERFAVDLPGPYVTAASPLTTPWRTMIIGGLDAIVASDLVPSLAPPSRLADPSWVVPGAAAWSWWSDGPSCRDPEAQKVWIDFAASVGWPYVLLDSGWHRDWAPEVIAYAKERGIGVFLWSHWQHLDTELEHREKLELWKEWGAAGVKIDFTESDGQERIRWFDEILAATARIGLMVVFHGGTIPRGTERTWPQFLSAEAVKGAEWIKPKPGKDPLYPPTHYLALAFTRNVQGPMDFTPCTFSAVRTISAGFELALSVIFESGIQHFADSLDVYRSMPEALSLLGGVPVAWDETRLLSGDPADHVVLARRHGDDWYVGAGVSGPARTVAVPLDFLDHGAWTAAAYLDADGDRIAVRTSTVEAGATLDLPVAANGGFTLRLTR